MNFSKNLYHFRKNMNINTNHCKNNRIYYAFLHNKIISNKLPICKPILPYTPIVPYKKKDIDINNSINKSINTMMINTDLTNKLNGKNNYFNIILISSLTGILSYSSLYIYVCINNLVI